MNNLIALFQESFLEATLFLIVSTAVPIIVKNIANNKSSMWAAVSVFTVSAPFMIGIANIGEIVNRLSEEELEFSTQYSDLPAQLRDFVNNESPEMIEVYDSIVSLDEEEEGLYSLDLNLIKNYFIYGYPILELIEKKFDLETEMVSYSNELAKIKKMHSTIGVIEDPEQLAQLRRYLELYFRVKGAPDKLCHGKIVLKGFSEKKEGEIRYQFSDDHPNVDLRNRELRFVVELAAIKKEDETVEKILAEIVQEKPITISYSVTFSRDTKTNELVAAVPASDIFSKELFPLESDVFSGNYFEWRIKTE